MMISRKQSTLKNIIIYIDLCIHRQFYLKSTVQVTQDVECKTLNSNN